MQKRLHGVSFLLLFVFGLTSSGSFQENQSQPKNAKEKPKILRGFRIVSAADQIKDWKQVVVVKTGEAGPDEKTCKPFGKITNLNEVIPIQETDGLDIWWQPKQGKALLIIADTKLEKTEIRKIDLETYLGIAVVEPKDLPRVRKIVATSQTDPGPDEKGYYPIQWVSDYREKMVLGEGFYSIWIIPDNGAKAQKIANRIRIQAGKEERVE